MPLSSNLTLTAPELVPIVIYLVQGEVVEKLPDVCIKLVVEQQDRLLNATLPARRLCVRNHITDALHITVLGKKLKYIKPSLVLPLTSSFSLLTCVFSSALVSASHSAGFSWNVLAS